MNASRSISALCFPRLSWLHSYQPKWARADIVAGITLAAYLLPAGLGDASLANLPPQAGLYACLFSGLVFWLFCSSRHTAVTVTSAISLLVGASLGDIAGGDTSRFSALAAGTAILTATVDGVLVMRHGADAFARAPQWSIDPEPQLIIDGGEEHDLSTVYNEVTLLPDGRAVVLRSLNVTPNGAAAGPRAAPGKW